MAVSTDRRSVQGGFTLIELMMVMVLLGLVVGIAVATMGGGGQSRELVNETNRLHAVLKMASEEAIFSNSEIGFSIDNSGYEFLQYQEKERKWVNAEKPFLKSHTFPEWLTTDFAREGDEIKLKDEKASENSMSSMGLSWDTGDDDKDGKGDKEKSGKLKRPQVMLLSSGEVTPFKLGLQFKDDSDTRIEIVGEAGGNIRLPHVEEQEEQRRKERDE